MKKSKSRLEAAVLGSKRPIVVALDSGSWQKDKVWLDRLNPEDFWGFKVGSILFTEAGPRVVEEIRSKGFEVFLDLKFHDIPNTVQGAVRSAFKLGVKLVTAHCVGGRAMLEAALREEQASDGKILLGITVLTSMDEKDLKEIGASASVKDQVLKLGALASQIGLKGFVCSVYEVADLKQKISDGFFLTPGVRLAPDSETDRKKDDQKRTATIEEAFQAGSSMVVIGRALTAESEWKTTWQKIISSTDASL